MLEGVAHVTEAIKWSRETPIRGVVRPLREAASGSAHRLRTSNLAWTVVLDG